MKQTRNRAASAVVMTLAVLAPVSAQEGLSSAVRSNAMVQMIAERGLECDLLKRWESAALAGMVAQDMAARPEDQLALMEAEAARLTAETACDAQLLSAWIEGSSRGFETEMLPPYLVAYRQMARMQNPPAAFMSGTTLTDHRPAIAAIDAKIEALAAAGAMPEGGVTWPAYSERVEEFIAGFMALMDSGDEDSTEVAQGRNLINQSVRITELWLQDP